MTFTRNTTRDCLVTWAAAGWGCSRRRSWCSSCSSCLLVVTTSSGSSGRLGMICSSGWRHSRLRLLLRSTRSASSRLDLTGGFSRVGVLMTSIRSTRGRCCYWQWLLVYLHSLLIDPLTPLVFWQALWIPSIGLDTLVAINTALGASEWLAYKKRMSKEHDYLHKVIAYRHIADKQHCNLICHGQQEHIGNSNHFALCMYSLLCSMHCHQIPYRHNVHKVHFHNRLQLQAVGSQQ